MEKEQYQYQMGRLKRRFHKARDPYYPEIRKKYWRAFKDRDAKDLERSIDKIIADSVGRDPWAWPNIAELLRYMPEVVKIDDGIPKPPIRVPHQYQGINRTDDEIDWLSNHIDSFMETMKQRKVIDNEIMQES